MTWQQVTQNLLNAAIPLTWVWLIASLIGRAIAFFALWDRANK